MGILKFIGYIAIAWYLLHWCYVLAMTAKTAVAEGELTLYWWVILIPAAIIGLALDLALQWSIGWLLFGELPWRWRGLLFSNRVQWHRFHSTGWRRNTMAAFWKRNLNVFHKTHIKG